MRIPLTSKLLLLCLYCLSLTLAAQSPKTETMPWKDNELLVKLAPGATETGGDRLILEMLSAKSKSTIFGTEVQVWHIPSELRLGGRVLSNPEEVAEYLRNTPHPYIEYAEPNYRYTIDATIPNDPSFGNLWGMNNANDHDIDASEAWDIDHDCTDVIVGVIDTGVDWTHPDLVDNIWQNLGEDADGDDSVLVRINGVWQFDPDDLNGIDNDGNGYKDDFIGWDFANNDNNPMDDNGHGTHCAGTIGARGNNGIGVAGVCWEAKMMALKFLGQSGRGFTSDAAAALNYATAKGAKITNNSWGGSRYSVTLNNAIQHAQNSNALFVAAAGNAAQNNDVTPTYPASYDRANIIAVASSTSSDVLSSFSNYGATSVDLAAPGSAIYSTTPPNSYGYMSGTSMAAPHVAGAAALLWCPTTNHANVKDALLNNVDVLPSLAGTCVTGGRLNVHRSLSNTTCCPANANFTMPTAPHCIGQDTFINTSTGANNYQWKVNNVTQSTDSNFIYAFPTAGTYTISLIAANDSCSDMTTKTITITAAPVASFMHFENGLSLTCIANAVPDATYSWDFGDSNTATGEQVEHTYNAVGTYSVCLTVGSGCGGNTACLSVPITANTGCTPTTPTIEWQNTIGGSGNESLMSIIQTSDGGYILGGYSKSPLSGDKTENYQGTAGYDDYWVVKLDATGQIIQWQNTIGGNYADELNSIIQTSDGGYLLGGTSQSNISGDKTEASLGGSDDYWIVKLDINGNIQWQNTIGGSGIDELNSIAQTTDGGYILGGTSYSGISGDKTEALMGGSDYWIVKLDATGQTIQWQNTIGGSGYEIFTSLAQISTGEYILGGSSNSNISADKNENSQGDFDYWIVKLDATGQTIQWQNTIGGSSRDELEGMSLTYDGGCILNGISLSNIGFDKTENCRGEYDYWVVKLDLNGTTQWNKTVGGNNIDAGGDIQQTADGGYVFGGYSYSGISGDKTEASLGSPDTWIVKLNAAGQTIEWQNTIGGSSTEYLKALKQTSDGGYVLGAYSISNISGDKTENSQGMSDYWVVKLSPDCLPCTTTPQFTLPTDSLCKNTPLTFTNTSTDAISYIWYVDNTSVSPNTNLTYTFTTGGTHIVKLIAMNGSCADTYTQTVTIDDACVWPGDTNADGTVNILDWLAIGLAYDATGTARVDQNIDYNAKVATDFATSFGGDIFPDINHKHADCNGDGTVNGADTVAIIQNYVPGAVPINLSDLPEALLSTETSTPVVAANTTAIIDITLRNAVNGGAVNCYGMAFILKFRGTNPRLNFTGSCFGTPGTDFIATYKVDEDFELLYVSITRITRTNVAALGRIGTMEVTIDEIPAGDSLLQRMPIQTAIIGDNQGYQVSASDTLLMSMPIQAAIIDDSQGYQIPVGIGATAVVEVHSPDYLLPPLLQAKAFLQGAFDQIIIGDLLMTTELSNADQLPPQQPYNTAPWHYAGEETAISIPDNAVDWVLLELRDANNPAQIVFRKAALLLNDGSIQDASSPYPRRVRLEMPPTPTNPNPSFVPTNVPYYLVLRHRNHLAVVSRTPLPITDNLMNYDFSTSPQQAMGTNQLVLVNGLYALKAGDFDGNGIINFADYNQYAANLSTSPIDPNPIPISQYINADCTLDLVTSIYDFNMWVSDSNIGSVGAQIVRY